jgi:integrase
MSGKRANGEGSIYQRKNKGSWVGAFYVEDEQGHRKRMAIEAKTRAEVRRKMNAAQARVSMGKPAKDSSDSLATWAEYWVQNILPTRSASTSTKDLYKTQIQRHVVPGLGAMKLGELKPSHVGRFLAERATTLSASSCKQIHQALNLCLDAAVREGLIARNVAREAERQKQLNKPDSITGELDDLTGKGYEPEEVARIREQVGEHRLAHFFEFILGTGVRRGEALGLQWGDIDFKAGTVTITRQVTRDSEGIGFRKLKTRKSHRRIAVASSVLDHLKKQKVEQNKEKLKVGDAWNDLGLVFATEAGGFLEPRNVSRWYESQCKKANVELSGIHSLRHTAANTMFSAGIMARVVADYLGHSDVALTLNTYTSTLDGDFTQAGNALGSRVSG